MSVSRPQRAPAVAGFEDIHCFWDNGRQLWTAQVLPGDCYVTRGDEVITTVLGSCVSTCIRDPEVRIGGMNHFMLPYAPAEQSKQASARYGCFALERLLNALYKNGARRERLEVKIFGGGKVLAGLSDIGEANIAFVRSFLADEGLALKAEDVGDTCARRLRYRPWGGGAKVQRLAMNENAGVADAERDLQRKVQKFVEGPRDVELF